MTVTPCVHICASDPGIVIQGHFRSDVLGCGQGVGLMEPTRHCQTIERLGNHTDLDLTLNKSFHLSVYSGNDNIRLAELW